MAERAPEAAGVNVALIEQCAVAARDAPQVFVRAKSAAFVPVAAMLVMVSALLPLFVSVTACAALAEPTTCWLNVKLAAESVAVGASAPSPERPIDCGLPTASSVMAIVALLVPAALGVKVTVIAHCALGATDAPQVFVELKSARLVPVIAMLVIFSAAVPVFVSVTDCEALITPTFSLGNTRPITERLTIGAAVPVPLTAAVCGLAGASSATLRWRCARLRRLV